MTFGNFLFYQSAYYFTAIGEAGYKKEPRPEVGGPNQKPLTIKPYPMKIQC